ncbi:MAG TPA: autotransporter assembly complex family protein [Thermodesulfobacteriota bacterium]|nr:autotransporter assembly complex family protein [Thermodesulfobacteriota bacterium]
MGAVLIFMAATPQAEVNAAESVRVEVEGLEGAALKNVEAALELPPGMVREGVVDKSLLEIFQRQVPEKVKGALEPFGYYEPKVSSNILRDSGKSVLRVDVAPGNPVRVSRKEVRLTGPGADQGDLKRQAAAFPLRVGDVLNQVRYETAKDDLRTRALNLGFLGAEYTTHVIRVNREGRKAEIELVLDTGPQYRFGDVAWAGAESYPVSFLERFLAFTPGDPYSYTRIFQTQMNLINSDRFSIVTIRAEKEEAQDLRVPVTVHLESSPPKRLRPGVGYATDTGGRFSLRYQDLNVFQRGHDFNADLTIGERLRSVFSIYSIPGAGHMDNRTNFKAGYQEQLLKPYDTRLLTVEGERARSFGVGMVGSAYLQFRQENFSEFGESGKSTMFMPGLRLSQRRIDDIMRPHKGYRYALDARGSTDFLGAETNFIQFLGNAEFMVPIVKNLYFLPRMQVGVTWESDPILNLPPSLRLYAGGDRSVRGYTYQSLGPKDAQGNVTGGKNLLVGSLEFEYDFTKTWGAAVFYDAGNAFNYFSDLHWAQGAGVGVRYYTPAGPIRLDLARQINVDHPGYQIHLTVGFAL